MTAALDMLFKSFWHLNACYQEFIFDLIFNRQMSEIIDKFN